MSIAQIKSENKKLWQKLPGYRFFLVVLVITSLALAKDFLLPITLAFILSLVLSPAVRLLTKLKIPNLLASLIMLVVSVAVFVGSLWLVTPAVAEWMSKAPAKLEQRFNSDKEIQQTISKLQETSKKVNDAVEKMDIEKDQRQTTQITVEQESNWSSDILASLQKAVTSVLLIFALTMFLLTSGQQLVLNLVCLSRRRYKRKQYIRLFQRLRSEVGQYLGAAFLVNLTLGCIASLIFWYLDVPLAWTWVVLITFLRFIPYVGISLIAILLTLVSLTHFDTLMESLMPLGIFMGLSTIFGFFIDPLVHGFRLKINPIVVFISVIFWGWLWGAAGAIIAVPLLTVALVAADCFRWKKFIQIVTAH
ncbi:AI-2E family transporter [Gayadomonas joobiniege]|uniref:AI-2E family transporter n=1 Tax=Gayadomonas joobiniege TaxID=1234606 RepID=UPI000379ECA4|nr:AI-2E family transporter [Gayadomonas joobiniege]